MDLNGDGYPDLAVSTLVGNAPTVAVLLNQGSTAPGKLSTPASYPGPAGLVPEEPPPATSMEMASRTLLSVAHRLLFSMGTAMELYEPHKVRLATVILSPETSIDDGVTDIAYVTTATVQGTSSLQVLLGSSSGKLSSGINVPLDYFLANAFPYIVPNTNGGNHVDLALVGGYTSILLGDGNGGFTFGNSYVLSGYPAATQVGSGGKTNLVFSAFSGLSILAGNGDGTFQGTPGCL